MSNLLATISIGTGALAAEQGALDATANNVANVNTPGYTRREPEFAENPPVVLGPLTFGTGTSLEKLQSVRDPILQIRIQEETGQQGALNAQVAGAKQIETLFLAQNGGDIGSQISALFATISQLSTDPSNLGLRQGVLTAAANLASTFRNTSSNLSQQRNNTDLSVAQTEQQVNTVTQQIAQLNGQIASLEGLHQDASTLVDQRDVLISQLSGLIDVSQIKADNGITLTTSNGAPLVSGNQSFSLSTQLDPSGVQHIFSQGNDITSQLNSGALGGLLAVRDQKIPALLTGLDTLAAGLANAFNGANAAGSDLNGNAGGNFFVAPPVSGQGAAASLAVADVANGSAELQSAQLVLQQLQDQRGSISGVSLDEEAAHMIQYQRAYEAAARIVDTVNQMLETVIRMGTTP